MDDEIQCPECERWFCVIWSNDGLGPPEYCPMCGEFIDPVDPEVHANGHLDTENNAMRRNSGSGG